MYLVSLGAILLIRDDDRAFAERMARAYVNATDADVLMTGPNERCWFRLKFDGSVTEEPCEDQRG